MSLMKEFKEFAVRGNVIDLAVGFVVGAAFGKIVSSLVADVVMPPIGLLLGGVDFSNLKVTLKGASVNAAGQVVAPVTLNYGVFINTVIDFLIIAFAIFMLVKFVNRFRRQEKPVPPAPTREEEILMDIRDTLKGRA